MSHSVYMSAGDLVTEVDIDSSPTFELIVEGEEVELESRSTTASPIAAAAAAVAMATYPNKRLRLADSSAVNIATLSECSTATVLVTGLSRMWTFVNILLVLSWSPRMVLICGDISIQLMIL